MRPRIDLHDDRGQFAGIEALPFGVLVFVLGSLLLTNAWAVVDAKATVTTAAREGARTYVEAPPDPGVARHQAVEAARDVIRDHGRDPANTEVAVETGTSSGARRCAAAAT